MRVRTTAVFVPGIVGMLSVGCAPSIESVTIVPGPDFQVVAVETRINESSSATTDPPQLAVAVLPNAAPTFVDAGPLVAAGSDLYRRDAMAMPPGQYRAQVTLPYRVIFSSTVRTVTRTADFTIAAPQGCFLFDIPGTDTGGWTSEGFFEVTPTNQRRDLCTGQTPLIASAGSNFPSDFSSPLNASFDSLMMPLNQPCFATPPANMQSNFVIADFVSPDLSGQAGWSAANGFELQAQTQGYLTPNADEQVRVQLIATSTAGETFAETDAGGAFVFHNLTGPWQALSMTRDGLQVARVRARVFVPRTHPAFGPDWRIAIDRVCPRPQ